MAYSESSNKATQRYKAAHIKRIPFEMQLEDYERLKAAAERANQKMNAYIREAVEARMAAESVNETEESPE